MGCHFVKNHYKTDCIVHLENGEVRFGLGLLSNLMAFSPQGVLLRLNEGHPSLEQLAKVIQNDAAAFAQLLAAPDVLENPVKVYSVVDGRVREQLALERDYPHVTADGQLIFKGTSHFATAEEAVTHRLSYLESAQKALAVQLQRLNDALQQNQAERLRNEEERARLLAPPDDASLTQCWQNVVDCFDEYFAACDRKDRVAMNNLGTSVLSTAYALGRRLHGCEQLDVTLGVVEKQSYRSLELLNNLLDGQVAELLNSNAMGHRTVCPLCEAAGFIHVHGCTAQRK